jgi:hypothetical protein
MGKPGAGTLRLQLCIEFDQSEPVPVGSARLCLPRHLLTWSICAGGRLEIHPETSELSRFDLLISPIYGRRVRFWPLGLVKLVWNGVWFVPGLGRVARTALLVTVRVANRLRLRHLWLDAW